LTFVDIAVRGYPLGWARGHARNATLEGSRRITRKMSQTGKGLVSYFGSTLWKNKKLWSFKVENDDSWYNCGENRPDIEKGATIEFSYEDGAKPNNRFVTRGSVRLLSSPNTGQVAPSVGPSNGGNTHASSAGTLSKDDYWKRREEREVEKGDDIHLLACRNSAIALVGHMLGREGVVTIPKSNAQAAVLGLVHDLTERFFNETIEEYSGESEQEDSETVSSATG
jgi:hypothetical protein